MILGIFFARFLSEQGTRVVHQSPPGCIVPETTSTKPQLLDWDTISEYVIPRQAFCNRYLSCLSPCSKYRILGHPVCIKNEVLYERNEFIFNFCVVIDAGEEGMGEGYESVVRRLAAFFTEMEIQERFLSEDVCDGEGDGLGEGGEGKGEGRMGRGRGGRGERRSIGALLEIVKEDLNNYNECMIPVDDANTINMKLFPLHPHPPPIKPHTVPVATVSFPPLIDPTWDLTLLSTLSSIDSITPVHLIASQSHPPLSLPLVLIAIQHLLYYESILLLDTFLFSNVYALTPAFADFVNNEEGLQEECKSYVLRRHESTGGQGLEGEGYWLIRLFTTFCVPRTVKEWLSLHASTGFAVLNYVDVRRLVQFGVIKGLLYRVHRYPISLQKIADLGSSQPPREHDHRETGREQTGREQTLHREDSHTTTTTTTTASTSHTNDPAPAVQPPTPDLLSGSVDGLRCFDQITAERGLGDEKILGVLKRFAKGDVEIMYR